ncbi:MAG: hypothetical protein J6V87_08195 [Prevotella sp.]|nr:hypothetical protein [Prevotella sp.]
MQKKIYDKPTVEVVIIKTTQQLLIGSVTDINNNVDIDFGGGGNVPALAPGFDFDMDFDKLEFI